MASSSKQNWQLGDAGILRKKEEDEELLVFGYSCKLFRDDEKALYIDQGKHLIPWMGDDTLKIDRYDGRGALYDLKQYEPLPGGYDESLWVGLSDSERHVEHLCNEERYRALHHNEDEEALYQEKCDAQSTEGRAVRRRRQFHSDPSCCPVCGVTVRSLELHVHLEHEIEKLNKIGKHRRLSELPSPSVESPSTAANRYETYVKIKSNRTNRIRLKKPKPSQVKCPVCNVCIKGNVEELNRHVENCLQDQDEEVNVDADDGTFTAYEWAGQERIRATTLLDGGYAAAGMSTVNRSNHEDENELIVDVETYGPSQYSEADVVLTTAETPSEDAERMALRAAVIHANTNSVMPESSVNRNNDGYGDSSDNAAISSPPPEISMDCDNGAIERQNTSVAASKYNCEVAKVSDVRPTTTKFTVNTADCVESSCVDISSKRMKIVDSSDVTNYSCGCLKVNVNDKNYVIKALKSRIAELEKMTPVKCLICLESYRQPVISVNCWHVYCEECWLHSLGAKKLCPQCNTITSPSDLRKIYI